MNAKNITYSPYLPIFAEAIKETPEIDFDKIKEIGEITKALNHKIRVEMIKIIRTRILVTVTDIFIALRIDQPVASQHLAVLRHAKLVLTDKRRKTNLLYD